MIWVLLGSEYLLIGTLLALHVRRKAAHWQTPVIMGLLWLPIIVREMMRDVWSLVKEIGR